ncbi:MAG: FecR domain-containing protein, partial [Rhodospirillaceae bacterium]
SSPATPGRPLLPSESVVTGPSGAAAVTTPDGAIVAVGTNSQLGGVAALDTDGATVVTLRLETGESSVLAPLGGEIHLASPAGSVEVANAQAGIVFDDSLSVTLMHGARHHGTATVRNE